MSQEWCKVQCAGGPCHPQVRALQGFSLESKASKLPTMPSKPLVALPPSLTLFSLARLQPHQLAFFPGTTASLSHLGLGTWLPSAWDTWP